MTGRGAALAVAGTVLLAACTHGGGGPRPTVTVVLDRLSAAIQAVNTSRAHLARDTAAFGTGVRRLDDVDAVGVTGDRAAVRAARQRATGPVAAAVAAVRRFPTDAAAYRTAVGDVRAAGTTAEGLDATQRAALDAVVTATAGESETLARGYVPAVGAVWARYTTLNEQQALWLARASNGWYRDQHERAGAYVSLTERDAVDAARQRLSAADRSRLRATAAASRAIARARTALASLLA